MITKVGGHSYGDLEDFTLIHDGEHIAPVDRNYWGVTFAADDDTFYVTVQWSKHTWLARGSLSRRTVVTLVDDAECPSLSPDGQHIVYKQRANLPSRHWRLARYDIATGRMNPLAERRSVDDQVEWLDDSHVLYGLPGRDRGHRGRRVGGAGRRNRCAAGPDPPGVVTGRGAVTEVRTHASPACVAVTQCAIVLPRR